MQSFEAQLDRQNQLDRFQTMFAEVLPTNAFQRGRLGEAIPTNAAEFRALPFCLKQDLVLDAKEHPPYGSNLTYPLENYSRYHQTSGTTGAPLRVLDTRESWDWWCECWQAVLDASGVTAADRGFFAFSFAPFIGFWSAFDAVSRRGALTVPGGGTESVRRLGMILDNACTALFCTPTYALHLAEIAKREGVKIADSAVRCLVHAGEPGASIPEVRDRIEQAWGARAYDHAGASEIGAYGVPCPAGRGIFINETEFIAEVLRPDSAEPVVEGETGELVVTNLGRLGWPVVRYRTGDIVRPKRVAEGLLLEGGILGRADEMILVRSVNIYPAAIEAVVRRVAGIAEFRITATRDGELDEINIEIESDATTRDHLAKEIHADFGLRVRVADVAEGTLPRWEAKARRFRDLR